MDKIKSATLQKSLLYFGAVSGLIFVSLTLLLGMMLPDYNSFSQTVSEIGQVDSPFQQPYAIMLWSVCLLGLVFCYQALKFAQCHRLSIVPIILIGSFALFDAGFALYPSPEPMHNIVGALHLFGYCSPLILTIMWKQYFIKKQLINFSGIAFLSIQVFLILNIIQIFPTGYFGMIQRGLLYSYYVWLIWLSITMARQVDNN